MKQRLDLLESGSDEIRKFTNAKLTETKNLLESLMESRTSEFRRMIDKFVSDMNLNLNMTINTVIHDKLEDMQNRSNKEWTDKLADGMRTAIAKAKEDQH